MGTKKKLKRGSGNRIGLGKMGVKHAITIQYCCSTNRRMFFTNERFIVVVKIFFLAFGKGTLRQWKFNERLFTCPAFFHTSFLRHATFYTRFHDAWVGLTIIFYVATTLSVESKKFQTFLMFLNHLQDVNDFLSKFMKKKSPKRVVEFRYFQLNFVENFSYLI